MKDPRIAAAGWTRVRLPDGRTGHVASRLARSPVTYRAMFGERALRGA